MYLLAEQNTRSTSWTHCGSGQSLANGTSLLTWARSASRKTSPTDCAGERTPFISISLAVARVKAVTPVKITVVSFSGSRLVPGSTA